MSFGPGSARLNIAGLSASRTAQTIAELLPDRRSMIALAGPPASGKSTVAAALVRHLSEAGHGAALLAMDGFHLGNDLLDARGLRARKGAPDTFDLAGFADMLGRVRHGSHVYAPVFDRTLDSALAAQQEITPDARYVVVEGNYLLFDAPGWRDLSEFWDVGVFLEVPERVLQDRLLARWREHGFAENAALEKAEGNDLPNARAVLRHRLDAGIDLTLVGG